MHFLNSKQNITYNNNNNNQSKPPLLPMLSNRRMMYIPKPNISNIIQIPISETHVVTESPKSNMLWGPAIWYLLHTLAEKIIPMYFLAIRYELFNNIFSICTHLPCPVCSEHAKEYLSKVNFNSINTKDDLKLMLFQFHNTVNKRNGYKLFTIDELNTKYTKANTINIIQNFMVHFKDKHRSPKLMIDDLQRARISVVLEDWFKTNITFFDL